MKRINLFLITVLVSACFFGCKKKNYRDAEMQINTCSENFYQDSTRLLIDKIEKRIYKVESEEQLDSIKPYADGLLNNVDLNNQIVYAFGAYIRSETTKCPELKGYKIKINDSEKQIEFSVKVKGYDGKSSRYRFVVGFIVIPRSEENYSISGTVIWAKVKLFNMTGSTKNEEFNFSY